jgi:hypothetical protein
MNLDVRDSIKFHDLSLGRICIWHGAAASDSKRVLNHWLHPGRDLCQDHPAKRRVTVNLERWAGRLRVRECHFCDGAQLTFAARATVIAWLRVIRLERQGRDFHGSYRAQSALLLFGKKYQPSSRRISSGVGGGLRSIWRCRSQLRTCSLGGWFVVMA